MRALKDELVRRWALRDQAGITLSELLVGMVVTSVVLAAVSGLLISNTNAARVAQDSALATMSSSAVNAGVSRSVRSAVALQVAEDGSRIDLELPGGVCEAWAAADGGFFAKTSDENFEDEAPSADGWRQFTDKVASGDQVFTPITDGVDYSFELGGAGKALTIEGSVTARALTSVSSPCWS